MLGLLCLVVDRERPGASEAALLRSAWVGTQHHRSSLVCRGLGSTVSALASWTAERGNARVLKDSTNRTEREKRSSKWRGSGGSKSASAQPVGLSHGPGLGAVTGRLAWSTFALVSQDKSHDSKLFLFLYGVNKHLFFYGSTCLKEVGHELRPEPLLY